MIGNKCHNRQYIYIYVAGRIMCCVVQVWENYVLCGSGVGELCAMWSGSEM